MDPLRRVQVVRQTSITSMFNIITLANFIRDSGYAVEITCIETSTQPVLGLENGIGTTGLQAGNERGLRKLSSRVRGALRLRRRLKSVTFDLLYVIDSWTLPTLWLATLGNLRWSQAKLVYHTFDWLEPGLVSPVHLQLERMACRRADLVVNTDRARARLQRTIYGLKKTPLWVQNCLSSKTLVPQPSDSLRSVMAGVSNPTGIQIIIYPTIVSGADSSQRMAWELIQALRCLPDSYRLVLFCREGTEYERCLAASSDPQLSERVRFLQPVPFHRLLEYVASADIGAIFYDDSKSSGYFMCNADKLSLLAACGVPYVASHQPNLESVTYRYGLGECCDPRDPLKLAESIRSIAEGQIPLTLRKQLVRKAFLDQLNFEFHGKNLRDALSALWPACAQMTRPPARIT